MKPLIPSLSRFLSSKLPDLPVSDELLSGKESQFTKSNDQRFYADLPESFWFATGSFLQQGTEVIPKTSAGEKRNFRRLNLIYFCAIANKHIKSGTSFNTIQSLMITFLDASTHL